MLYHETLKRREPNEANIRDVLQSLGRDPGEAASPDLVFEVLKRLGYERISRDRLSFTSATLRRIAQQAQKERDRG